jgi:hypothetical protein
LSKTVKQDSTTMQHVMQWLLQHCQALMICSLLTPVAHAQVLQHDSLDVAEVLRQHLTAPTQRHQLAQAAQASHLQCRNMGWVSAALHSTII